MASKIDELKTKAGCGCSNAQNDGNPHSQLCEMRETQCQIIGCTWKGSVKSLLEHLQNNHKNFPIIKDNMASLRHYSQMKSRSTSFVSPVLANGCLHWKYIVINYSYLSVFLKSVPTSPEHLQTVAIIKMGKDKVYFASTNKVYGENEETANILPNLLCMNIPFSMLDHLVTSENELNYTCEIVKPEISNYKAMFEP